MTAKLIWIDPAKCLGCGECLPACGRHLVIMPEDVAVISRPESCVACGHCKAVCPVDAPQLPGVAAADFLPAPAPEGLPSPEVLLSFLRSRRSIRVFRPEPVERAKLEALLQAARYTPTAQNRQALGYVVVASPEALAEVTRLTVAALVEQAARLEAALAREAAGGSALAPEDQAWRQYPPAFRLLAELTAQGEDPLFHHAPAVVAVHVHPEESLHPKVEAGLAAMHLALMAVSLGLGTCFCGLLEYALRHSGPLARALYLPPGHLVPISFMLGYPELTYRRLPARRPLRVTWR
ncbi:MAG: nitroreductase family protein [Deltaproteobacteria bacterium]|nr:nitroreductase family protein [Deltaproteobacteria bacterium]